MERGLTHGLMASAIKAIGLKERWKALENFTGLMEVTIEVST